MAEERELMEKHLDYLDELSDELEELSLRYESVANLYALAVQRLELEGPEWKQAYVTRMQTRLLAEEGEDHGVSVD